MVIVSGGDVLIGYVQDERTSTGAGSRTTAKVVPCASTDCAYVRLDTTCHPATASASDEKVY